MYSWKKIIMMISCMIMLVPLKSFASEDVPFEMLNYNLETKTVEEYTFKGNKVPDFCPGFEGTETENNNGRGIIGSDDRNLVNTKTAPYSYIGMLEANYNEDAAHCTGFLVSPDTVVTAAGAIFRYAGNKTGSMPNEVYFYPGYSKGSMPYGKAKLTSIHIPSQFKTQGYEGTLYNFAILKLNTPIGNKSGYFGIRNNVVGTAGESIGSYMISGYVNGEVEGPDSFAYNQVCATGNVLLSSNGYTLKYTIDTANVGQEGAPIFKRSGGVDYIAGINCLTIKNDNGSCIGNQGRYITKALYELIVSLKG